MVRVDDNLYYSPDNYIFYNNNNKYVVNNEVKIFNIDQGIKMIAIVTSNGCNLRCPYCYEAKEENPEWITDEHLQKISIFRNTIEKIHYFGGEPLLDFNKLAHIHDVVKQTLYKKVYYTLTTNGVLIDDEIVSWFVKNDIYVVVSWDGFDSYRYNGNMQMSKKVINNVFKLQKAGVKFTVRLTVSNILYSTLYHSVMYLAKNKMKFAITPCIDTTINNVSKDVVDKICKLYDQLPDEYLCFSEDYFHFISYILRGEKRYYGCDAGRHRLIFNVNGKVYDCQRRMYNCSSEICNIADVDKPLDLKKYFNNGVREVDECKQCVFANLCGGGCQYSRTELTCMLEKQKILKFLRYFFNSYKNTFKEEKI